MSDRGFVMSYFRTKREALHLAISPNGHRWYSLNRNRPILSSTLGTKTMRDPFLFQDRDGLFHVLSTDGWTSRQIIHAVSEDLLHWREMEALPVMVDVPGARNSWAPEAFFDTEEGTYRLIWSSTVSVEGPPGLRDHRIWSVRTGNFREFGAPEAFFDPGYSVIDATVARHGDRYIMAFKDERGEDRPDTPYKAIRLATSTGDCRSFGNVSGTITPPLTEGPILFRCHDRWMLLYDHYKEGRFGASVSVDLERWVTVTDRIRFPEGPRHGSVIEIGSDLYRRLERHI